jgi:hypothetical protein
MRIPLYAQNRHSLVVNGQLLTGFAEGDFIQLKLDGNAAARTQGGDGPSINISTAQGGQVTIGLLPTSPSLGLMYEMYQGQKTNPTLFTISVLTGVQEVIKATGCAFGDLPQFQTGGPTMQQRQFTFEAQKIDLDTSELEVNFAS